MKKKINLKDNIVKKIKELAKNLIFKSHSFIRDISGRSSFSLREIRRFNIFFEFFYQNLSFKKNDYEKLMDSLEFEKEYTFYQSLTDLELIIYSINLSIYIFYFLRISNKNKRQILLSNEISSKFYNNKDFLNIPILEQNFILKNINLEKGISKNLALLENIFSLFSCINNKVPIFIIGKPGCSKSLSVQLINKAMKGNSSTNSLFKNLPKIIINSYQGSMGSTSKGVENVFYKARSILKNLNKEDKKN